MVRAAVSDGRSVSTQSCRGQHVEANQSFHSGFEASSILSADAISLYFNVGIFLYLITIVFLYDYGVMSNISVIYILKAVHYWNKCILLYKFPLQAFIWSDSQKLNVSLLFLAFTHQQITFYLKMWRSDTQQ